jgi:hypothetical protein
MLGLTGPLHGEPDHLVAYSKAADAGAEFGHHSRQVAALTGRKGRWKHMVQRATADHSLTRIDAGRPDLNQNLADCRDGTRHVAYLKNVDAAKGIELHCLRHEDRSNPEF